MENISAVIQYATYCSSEFKGRVRLEGLSQEKIELCDELYNLCNLAIEKMRVGANYRAIRMLSDEERHQSFLECLVDVYTIDKSLLRDKYFSGMPDVRVFLNL